MSRLILGPVLALAALLICAGCGSLHPKDASDWTYNPPEGLIQQANEVRGNTVFNGEKENGFVTNLQVKAQQTQNQSAEQIGKDVLAKLSAEPGITVKEQEPYTIPDSDAYTWLVNKKTAKGNTASQRQFIVSKGGYAVLFTMTAAEASMSKWDQLLADSLQSFHWGR